MREKEFYYDLGSSLENNWRNDELVVFEKKGFVVHRRNGEDFQSLWLPEGFENGRENFLFYEFNNKGIKIRLELSQGEGNIFVKALEVGKKGSDGYYFFWFDPENPEVKAFFRPEDNKDSSYELSWVGGKNPNIDWQNLQKSRTFTMRELESGLFLFKSRVIRDGNSLFVQSSTSERIDDFSSDSTLIVNISLMLRNDELRDFLKIAGGFIRGRGNINEIDFCDLLQKFFSRFLPWEVSKSIT